MAKQITNTSITTFTDIFDSVLRKRFNYAVEKVLEQEIEKAKTSLENALKQEAVKFTVEASRFCDIQRYQDRIVVSFMDKTKEIID